MNDFDKAKLLLNEFKGSSYLFGSGILNTLGETVASVGNKAALVRETFPGSDNYVQTIRNSLTASKIQLIAEIKGARPNAPKEDMLRIAEELQAIEFDVIISFGGGSTIDATKAAQVLHCLGGDIEDYFGSNLVTNKLRDKGKILTPHIAIQTVASSGAHLTKYANITDMSTGQKKLIVDEAIVPARSVFDYSVTHSAPAGLTADGAFDGMSHMLEVLYGAVGKAHYEKAAEIITTGLALILEYLPQVLERSSNAQAREALCLGADLGGYAIMTGGTNGGHLTSFSLVDVMSHGRACALMNPYYTVFFAPAIEEPLRLVGEIFHRAGLTKTKFENLKARELGIAVAEAMFSFARKANMPTRLADVEGFTQAHIERALSAAKNPQLKMKLQNMPIPLTAEMVDEYMGSVLEAARDGDVSLIKTPQI